MKINDWINTSNYVYNKTLDKIKGRHKINFINLRDLLVTDNTKKFFSPSFKSLVLFKSYGTNLLNDANL